MTKSTIKIYLEDKEIQQLKNKAEQSGFTGRGAVSHYIQKISREPIVFLDSNAKIMLEALKLNTGMK